ncbi:hypothetical protein HD806DRAFT_515334 [Xylariaceae sp. AK1471]|nr:hypothetical protein HD806DRAFT_515334 [Xylariaceae sp. AK1471]
MSGFEVAGIVLGAIPLLISALEHFKTGRGAVATFVKYNGLLDDLLHRLGTQRLLFYFDILQLLRNAGVEGVVDRAGVTEDDCLLILQDAKTGIQLQEYLGLHYDTFLNTLGRYENCLKKIAKKLKHIRRLPDAAKDDLGALLAANPPVQGHFEFQKRISFTIERGALSALIDELKEDRLSLKVIIKGMRTEKEFTTKFPSHESQRLSRFLTQVSTYAKSLFLAMCETCACSRQNNHKVLLELHHRIPESKTMDRFSRQATNSMAFNILFGIEDNLQEVYVEAKPDDDGAETATPRSTSRQVSFHGPRNGTPSIVIVPELLLSEASTTKAMGICDWVAQRNPRGEILNLRLSGKSLDLSQEPCKPQRGLPKPTSLEEVLRKGALDRACQITPKQRTLLALNIASSIIQLHQTCWSNPPFSSKVVKFISHRASKVTAVHCAPYIEQVTERSRATSLGPNPKAALLELAILLLEIWHHETLEMWAARANFGETHTAPTRTAAAIQWVELTSDYIPVHHLEAIEQCLALYVGRLRHWDDDEFLKGYCENIIKPLQKSCESW